MVTNPIVSIGVPVFNSEATVLNSLNALRNQSYQNIEIIIGDNASTDNTEDICRRFADSDERCTYYRLDHNRGVPGSFNFVFHKAVGQLFLWAAADDSLDPTFIEQGVRFLDDNPAVVVACPLTRVRQSGSDRPMYTCTVNALGRDIKGTRRIINSCMRLPMFSIYGVFRRHILQDTGLLNSVLGNDAALMQEVALRGAIETNHGQVLNYNARERWNTGADDRRVFSGEDVAKKSWYSSFLYPGGRLVLDRVVRIRNLDRSRSYRLLTIGIVFTLEVRRVLFMCLNRVLRAVLRERLHRRWIQWIYWRFLHSEDIHVEQSDVYSKRVILAQFG